MGCYFGVSEFIPGKQEIHLTNGISRFGGDSDVFKRRLIIKKLKSILHYGKICEFTKLNLEMLRSGCWVELNFKIGESGVFRLSRETYDMKTGNVSVIMLCNNANFILSLVNGVSISIGKIYVVNKQLRSLRVSLKRLDGVIQILKKSIKNKSIDS